MSGRPDKSASPTVFGLVEPDNVTIKTSSGVLTAIGAAGASLGVGTTAVAAGTPGFCFYDNGGVLGNQACVVPGGASGALQYNNSSAFGGIAGFTSDGTNITAVTGTLTLSSSDLKIKGSSTGVTSIVSGNATANTFTWTISGVTDTFAGVNSTDQIVSGGANIVPVSLGTISSGVTNIDCGKNAGQWLINNGAFTLGAPSVDGMCVVEVIAGSSAGAITTSNFSTKGVQGGYTSATSAQALVTFTNGLPVVSWITNTLSLNSPVYLQAVGTGTLAGNFTANTIYYVVATGTISIQVSPTPSGAAIVASSTPTGAQVGEEPSVFDLTITRINAIALGIWTQLQ